MVDRATQPRGSCLRAVVAPLLIIVGLLLGLAEIGARWLEGGTDPIMTYSNVHPPSYADSDLAALFQKYDAVFVGRVIGFNERNNPGLLGELYTTRRMTSDDPYAVPHWEDVLPGVVFRIEVAWKAVRQTEIEMPVAFENSDDGCVGRHFDVGTEYLVYARRWAGSGRGYFSTSVCDPTTLFPYKYDPAHQRVYGMPSGIPDLNLDTVGDGYIPSEPANLLRFQPPVVLIVSGVLMLAGVFIVIWPLIKRIFHNKAAAKESTQGEAKTQ